MMTREHAMRVGLAAALSLLVTMAGAAQTLKEVEVRGVGDGTRIVLDVDGEVTHKSFMLTNPERIVLDLLGASNSVRVGSRSLPAGPVKDVRISQYARDPQAVTRLVCDLRQPSQFEVTRVGNKLVLAVSPTGAPAPVGAVAARQVPASEPAPAEKAVAEKSPSTAPAPAARSAPAPAAEITVAAPSSPAPVEDAAPSPGATAPTQNAAAPEAAPAPGTATHGEVTPRLAAAYRRAGVQVPEDRQAPELIQAPVTVHESSGRRINLDLQGADIRTVLRTLSDYAGKNIIAGKDVEGQVNARIKDAPWQDALAAILKAHGYGYVEENGIIRVGEMAKIRNEELEEVAAARKREELLPIVTEVFKLEFANAAELKASLAEMLTNRGKLQTDSRTNSLIVSDIRLNVEKIGSMARELDDRTQQVEIVSKLVDVSADDSKNLGISWSLTNVSLGDVTGGAAVTAPTPGAVGALRIGTVQSWGQLDMLLDALARSKRANIVSNPNITTVNNREAKILVGSKIPLIVADEAGNAITQLTTVGIQMRVTPHVNSDKTITLDLHPEVSELSSQATVQGGVIINTSEADTRVVVNDSETAIIGGLMRDVSSEVKTGIPVLQDIPGLGWLFRTSNKSTDKRELIIFVTPRLLESASLGGQQYQQKP
ncbi:MAG TPA: AMIN domain-containing protein [Candidatus Krumholzibacteria bacterium]|nr:AMIN domain-containing protein [Candidatus Krumholzibacteria bacterium]